MKDKNSIASKIGAAVGTAIVGAVGACLAGSVLALTLKYLIILFGWVF